MIYKVKHYLIIIFFFCYNSNLAAESKILFIDVEFIYSNSIVGKKINEKIQTEAKKINTELINLQKKIKEDKDKIVSQKNVLSQEELKKKTIDLEKKAKEYNDIITNKNEDLAQYSSKAKFEFYKQLTLIVTEYAKKNSIEMIVKKENILIGKTNLDVTKDILNIFNENIKNIKVQ